MGTAEDSSTSLRRDGGVVTEGAAGHCLGAAVDQRAGPRPGPRLSGPASVSLRLSPQVTIAMTAVYDGNNGTAHIYLALAFFCVLC